MITAPKDATGDKEATSRLKQKLEGLPTIVKQQLTLHCVEFPGKGPQIYINTQGITPEVIDAICKEVTEYSNTITVKYEKGVGLWIKIRGIYLTNPERLFTERSFHASMVKGIGDSSAAHKELLKFINGGLYFTATHLNVSHDKKRNVSVIKCVDENDANAVEGLFKRHDMQHTLKFDERPNTFVVIPWVGGSPIESTNYVASCGRKRKVVKPQGVIHNRALRNLSGVTPARVYALV